MRTRDAAKTEAVPEAVRTTAAPNEVREARGIPAARWFVPACMATPFVFAIVVLVLMPEGARPVGARALAAAVVAAAATVTVVIARKATDRVRGAGMLIMGLAALAVTGGVVVSRVAVAVSMRELLGLLVGLAGLVLVVAGWRRLLHDIGPPWVRAVVAVVATLAVAQFVLLPAGVALDVTNRFRPAASGRTPHDLGLTYEDVRIPSTGGVAIAAWWIPASNGAAVVVLPGAGSTRDDVLAHAAFVAREGYGVLLLDWRGHGASEGRPMEFGWGAERDVRAAVSWLLDRPGVTRGIGLLGLSMGAEVALTTAALDPRVDAVLAEGASARTWADARRDPNAHPVSLANEWVIFALLEALAPEPRPAPLIEAVTRIEAPVLLITGAPANEASLGPVSADAAPGVVELWAVPDAPHVGALARHPNEYRERVLALFERSLLH